MHADSKLLCIPSICLGPTGKTRSVCTVSRCVVCNGDSTVWFSVCQLVSRPRYDLKLPTPSAGANDPCGWSAVKQPITYSLSPKPQISERISSTISVVVERPYHCCGDDLVNSVRRRMTDSRFKIKNARRVQTYCLGLLETVKVMNTPFDSI